MMKNIIKYEKLLKDNPNDSNVHFRLGNEYRRLNCFQQAIYHYKEAIRIKPKPEVQECLGFIHLELKHYPGATKYFTQILRANPRNASAYNGLGEANFSMKMYKEATKRFLQAIEIEPSQFIYHYNLGKAFQKLKRYIDAINEYKQAIKLKPSNGLAYSYMGFAYCKLGRNQEAVKACKKAIRLNPRSQAVYENLDKVYKRIGIQPINKSLLNVGDLDKSQGLTKVAGMQSLKRLIYEEIIRPIHDPKLYSNFGLSLPKGILFYWPSGCGKTFISKQLAEELGWSFLEIQGSSVLNNLTQDRIVAIREIFAKAEKKAPTFLLIDQFEKLVPKRSKPLGLTKHNNDEINEFLTQLNECTRKNIFVIATTNEPNKIEEAVRQPGRLGKIIFAGLPDLKARTESLRMCLDGRPRYNINITRFARMLDGYTHNDIKNITDEAVRLVLKEGKPFISNQHVAEAIRRNPSSLTSTALSLHKNYQQREI